MIIGGGVIGVEFANVFSNLGAKVTVVEMLPEILPAMDGDIAKALHKELQKQGVQIFTAAKVLKVTDSGDQAVVMVEKADGTQTEVTAECVLVAPGRAAYTDGLQLEKAGIVADGKGIVTNHNLQTSQEHIYAIGDVRGGIQLAHLASAEGIFAAAEAVGQKSGICLSVVPSCIYTSPEVASVGLTEEACREQGLSYRAASFLLNNNGKAQALGMGGSVKLLYDAENSRLLGLHIIGPHATDLIAEGALAMANGLTVRDIAQTIHAHPTLSEALWEAARESL